MALNSGERRAFIKAARMRGWESVTRNEHGRYLVHSASGTSTYVVTGTDRIAADHTCSCHAGISGRMCWHRAAVVMARQRAEWHAAKRRAVLAASAAQAAPAVAVPAQRTERAEAVLRLGGVEYRAAGRNLLDAFASVTPNGLRREWRPSQLFLPTLAYCRQYQSAAGRRAPAGLRPPPWAAVALRSTRLCGAIMRGVTRVEASPGRGAQDRQRLSIGRQLLYPVIDSFGDVEVAGTVKCERIRRSQHT